MAVGETSIGAGGWNLPAGPPANMPGEGINKLCDLYVSVYISIKIFCS